MRIALAVFALLAAALSYGILTTAFVLKTRQVGNLWLAVQAILGVWPNVHWLDVAIFVALSGLGAVFACVGLTLLRPPV